MQRQTTCKEFWDEFKVTCKVTLESPQYEFFLNAITMIMLCTITMKRVGKLWKKSTQEAWCDIQIAYNIIMFILYLTEILVTGLERTLKFNFRIWPEALCQFMFWSLIFTGNQTQMRYQSVRVFELIIFIRLLKFVTLMYELKTTRIFIETMRNLVQPILNMIAVLFIVYYFFALIGMCMFGGYIRSDLEQFQKNDVVSTYHSNNFNDWFGSLVTLFSLMVVNNWQF